MFFTRKEKNDDDSLVLMVEDVYRFFFENSKPDVVKISTQLNKLYDLFIITDKKAQSRTC